MEMSPKRKPLAKAHALFDKGLKEVGGNKSKINVVYGKIQMSFLWEASWLQNTLLKEKVLQEKAGISNLKLLPQSVRSCVRLSSRLLSVQADARAAYSDSTLTARLTLVANGL